MRQDVFDQIRDSLVASPLWPKIEAGKTDTQCIGMSRDAYQWLNKSEHKIPGLSLAIVSNFDDRFPIEHVRLWKDYDFPVDTLSIRICKN